MAILKFISSSIFFELFEFRDWFWFFFVMQIPGKVLVHSAYWRKFCWMKYNFGFCHQNQDCWDTFLICLLFVCCTRNILGATTPSTGSLFIPDIVSQVAFKKHNTTKFPISWGACLLFVCYVLNLGFFWSVVWDVAGNYTVLKLVQPRIMSQCKVNVPGSAIAQWRKRWVYARIFCCSSRKY